MAQFQDNGATSCIYVPGFVNPSHAPYLSSSLKGFKILHSVELHFPHHQAQPFRPARLSEAMRTLTDLRSTSSKYSVVVVVVVEGGV